MNRKTIMLDHQPEATLSDLSTPEWLLAIVSIAVYYVLGFVVHVLCPRSMAHYITLGIALLVTIRFLRRVSR